MWKLTISILIVIISAFNVFSNVSYSTTVDECLPLKVSERVLTNDGMELTLEMAQPLWSSAGSENDPVEVIEIPSGGVMEVEGYPIVPIVGSLFRLPPRSGIVIEVIEAEYETYSNIEYAVYTGGDESADLVSSASPEDSWYPGMLASVGEPAIMHDFRVGNLVTYPVQVNTARREVRVYSNIQVAIRFEGTDTRNAIPFWPTAISETFLPWYRLLLDWDEDELDEYTLYRGAVQVVARNSVLTLEDTQDWVEWKLQKGWELDFLTEDDATWTAAGIKSELQSRWDNAELKYDYVVIIGDASGAYSVPPGQGYGDHEYCRLAGNDQLIDCMHGRISVETSLQVATYAAKVLAYERDPDMGNTGWYPKGTLTCTSSSSGMSTVYLSRYARDAMYAIGYDEANVYAYNDGGGSVNGRGITDLNDGVGMYGHRGWLGTGLDDGEINSLTNDFMTPVVLDITCNTGDWTSWSEGTNEVWMRAGSVNAPRGGIAAMGMHTSGTHTKFNNVLTGGAWFSLLVQRNPTVGQAYFAAKYNLYVNLNDHLPNDVSNFNQWCNMMGDPLVYVWTGVPRLLDVSAPADVELGENSYSVTVQDDDTGELIEGAWVTLYKMSGNDEIIARGKTGPNGEVTLYTPVRYSGDAKLTVSRQHYAPYQLDVSYTTHGDRIGHYSIIFQDDGHDETVGNDNGIPEAGETVGLVITAKNYGTTVQTDVEATATCGDDAITSISGVADFGGMLAGQTSVATSLILVEIDPATQHDWIAHLELEFTSNQGMYHDGFPLTLSAAQFAYVDIEIVGITIDPGETTDMSVTVSNVGGSDATGTSDAQLVSNDTLLIVEQGTATFPQMLIGQEGESSHMSITAHPLSLPGHQAGVMVLITTSSNQVDTVHITIPIGIRGSNDPTGPDRYGYYAYDNTDTEYSDLVPGYDWVEINPNEPGSDYDGTNLNLVDSGNNVDDSELIDLPFTVQYYGQTFTQMTVTANGFISMGDQEDVRNPRNWTIPSPMGPNYMIAPYWDERRTLGSNNVYYYYDEIADRIIVEWFQVTDINASNPCTFELIIYNLQEGHDTWTGDNEIQFQYGTLNHSTGSWTDVPYFTTGIENGDQTDGIMYSYWNQATPGSAPVQSSRAILFTTNLVSASGRPYPFSLLSPADGSQFSTDEAISLSWEEAVDPDEDPITYEVIIATDPNFVNVVGNIETDQTSGVIPATGENQTYYWRVHAQDLDTDGRWSNEIWRFITYSPLNPTEFSLLTPANGAIVDHDVVTITWEESTDPNWEFGALLGGPTMSQLVAERAVEFDAWADLPKGSTEGDGQGIAELDDFGGPDNFGYRFLDSDQLGGPEYQWYDLDQIGTYSTAADADEAYQTVDLPFSFPFYGQEYDQVTISANGYIHFGTPFSDWSNSTIPNLDGPPAMVAPFWDDLSPQNGGGIFYAGSAALGVFGVQWESAPHYTYGGCDYTFQVHLYSDGQIMFFYESMSGTLNSATIGIETPDQTTGLLMSFNELYVEDNLTVLIVPWDINYRVQFSSSPSYSNGFVEYATETSFTIGQEEILMLITEPAGFLGAWTDAHFFNDESPFGLWPPDNGDDELDWTIPDGLTVYWRIAAITQWETYTLGDPWPAGYHFTVDLQAAMTDVAESEIDIPVEYDLSSAYPNPFNPATAVQVALPEASNLTVAVYNVLGKEVTTLAEGRYSAGYHQLTFNGSDLASGIYFIRATVPGELNELRKVVLMK